MEPKHPQDSKTTMTDLVLPSETNAIHTLFGGELLARMDRAASIAAERHSGEIVVTASVNHVAFKHAVPLGSIVTSITSTLENVSISKTPKGPFHKIVLHC